MTSRNDLPTLETFRLIMRPVQMSDAPRYQSIFADFQVIEFLDGNVIPWPYPENGVVEFLNFILPKMEAGETIVWAIVPKGTDEMIGVLHLNPHSESDHRGFWLGRDYWGHGYMSEAVAASQDYCFDVLGMPRLLLSNAEPNAGSARLKEKSGAKFLWFQDDKFYAGGGTYRSMKWELTAEAWRENRAKFFEEK